jgi:hypothetical protein
MSWVIFCLFVLAIFESGELLPPIIEPLQLTHHLHLSAFGLVYLDSVLGGTRVYNRYSLPDELILLTLQMTPSIPNTSFFLK